MVNPIRCKTNRDRPRPPTKVPGCRTAARRVRKDREMNAQGLARATQDRIRLTVDDSKTEGRTETFGPPPIWTDSEA